MQNKNKHECKECIPCMHAYIHDILHTTWLALAMSQYWQGTI